MRNVFDYGKIKCPICDNPISDYDDTITVKRQVYEDRMESLFHLECYNKQQSKIDVIKSWRDYYWQRMLLRDSDKTSSKITLGTDMFLVQVMAFNEVVQILENDKIKEVPSIDDEYSCYEFGEYPSKD